jgi:hypothetical protein
MNIKLIIILIVCIIIILYFSCGIEKFEEHTYTPDEIYTHLVYIDDKLNSIGVKHWLMYGTLLGAVRDNNIIPFYYDFDLGAYVDDCNDILKLNDTIKKDGYSLVKPETSAVDYKTLTEHKNVWRVSLKVMFNNVPMGDIYLYSHCDDGYMRRYDPISKTLFWPQTVFHSYFIDNLTRVAIRDIYFWAPIDSEFLLAYWYGNTWRTPIKSEAQGGQHRSDRDYYGGDKNMKLNNMKQYLMKRGINNKPKIILPIDHIYPAEQKEWQIINDNITV